MLKMIHGMEANHCFTQDAERGCADQADNACGHAIEKGVCGLIIHQLLKIIMSDHGEGKGGGEDGNRDDDSSR